MTDSQEHSLNRDDKVIRNLKKINEENSRILAQAKPEERSDLSPLLDRLQLQEEVATLYILLPKIRKLLVRIDQDGEISDRPNKRSRKNKIRKEELEILLQHTENAIEILTYEHPSIYLAQEIRINIQKTLNVYERRQPLSFFFNRWIDFCNSKSDPLKVVTGLIISTPIFLCLFFIALYSLSIGQNNLTFRIEETRQRLRLVLQYKDEPKDPSQDSVIVGSQVQNRIQSEIQRSLDDPQLNLDNLSLNKKILIEEAEKKRELTRLEEIQKDYSLLFFLILVASSGALGSIISLFTRMNDFEEKEYSDPVVLLLVGAFKPLIGAVFGLLLFAILKSGILAVQVNPTRDQHKSDELFLCSLAFVVGFSERLAKDVIKRTENTLLGNSEPNSLARSENRQDENQES